MSDTVDDLDALLDQLVQLVQPHLRDDVRQELAVALLTGDLSIEHAASAVPKIIRSLYRSGAVPSPYTLELKTDMYLSPDDDITPPSQRRRKPLPRVWERQRGLCLVCGLHPQFSRHACSACYWKFYARHSRATRPDRREYDRQWAREQQARLRADPVWKRVSQTVIDATGMSRRIRRWVRVPMLEASHE